MYGSKFIIVLFFSLPVALEECLATFNTDCLHLFTYIDPCLLVFTYVYTSFPMFTLLTRIYLCLLVFTYVNFVSTYVLRTLTLYRYGAKIAIFNDGRGFLSFKWSCDTRLTLEKVWQLT